MLFRSLCFPLVVNEIPIVPASNNKIPGERSPGPMEATTASGGNRGCSFLTCDKLDRVANWVGMSVASAFFASLERCSCITLNTADPEDEDFASDGALILPNLPPSSVLDPRPA